MVNDAEKRLQMILQQVEANASHIANLHTQQLQQHQEFMAAFRELTKISQAQLDIARGYQKLIGDPLERGSNAFKLVRSIIAWTAGLTLTIVGLKELFDSFFVPRIKP